MRYEDIFQSIPCEPEIVKEKGVEIELHPIPLQLIKQWLDEIIPPKPNSKPIVRIKRRVRR
jgi:hypothetical protein